MRKNLSLFLAILIALSVIVFPASVGIKADSAEEFKIVNDYDNMNFSITNKDASSGVWWRAYDSDGTASGYEGSWTWFAKGTFSNVTDKVGTGAFKFPEARNIDKVGNTNDTEISAVRIYDSNENSFALWTPTAGTQYVVELKYKNEKDISGSISLQLRTVRKIEQSTANSTTKFANGDVLTDVVTLPSGTTAGTWTTVKAVFSMDTIPEDLESLALVLKGNEVNKTNSTSTSFLIDDVVITEYDGATLTEGKVVNTYDEDDVIINLTSTAGGNYYDYSLQAIGSDAVCDLFARGMFETLALDDTASKSYKFTRAVKATGNATSEMSAVRIYDYSVEGYGLFVPEAETTYKISFKYAFGKDSNYTMIGKECYVALRTVKDATSSTGLYAGEEIAKLLNITRTAIDASENWLTYEGIFTTGADIDCDSICLALITEHDGTVNWFSSQLYIDDIEISNTTSVIIHNYNADGKDVAIDMTPTSTFEELAVPTAENAKFVGFYTDFACTEAATGEVGLTTELWAKWQGTSIINTYDDEGVYYKKSDYTDNWRRFTDESLTFGSESSSIDYDKIYGSIFARWGAFETADDGNRYYKFNRIYVNPTTEPDINIRIYDSANNNHLFVPEKNTTYKISLKYKSERNNQWDEKYLDVFGVTNTDVALEGNKFANVVTVAANTTVNEWTTVTAYFNTGDIEYNSLALVLTGSFTGITEAKAEFYVDDITLTKIASTKIDTVNTLANAKGFPLVADGSVYSVNEGDSAKLTFNLKNSNAAVGSVIAVKVADTVTPIITIDEENADFGVYATTFTATADGETEIVVYNDTEVSNARVIINDMAISSYEQAAIKGDANLDGVFDIRDLVNVKKSIATIKKLYGDYMIRADLNNDGKCSANDLTVMRKVMLNVAVLEELTDVVISYEFANDTAGSAEGTIIVNNTNTNANNYCDIYWANNNEPIADTYYIGSVNVVAGSNASLTLDSNKAIPEGATQVMVFDGLNYNTYDLPVEKLGNFKYSQIPFVKDYTKKQNVSNVAVVYSGVCDADELATVRDFRSALSNVLGAQVEILSDSNTLNENDYYIVVGNTFLSESNTALAELGGKTDADYVIMQIDNKTVINAKNLYAYEFAFGYFFNNICTDDNSTIEADYKYVSKTTPTAVTLAGTDITDYTVVHSKTSSIIEMDAVDYLVSFVLKNTGELLTVVDDSSTATANEIVIGSTNRTTSDHNSTADNGYVITVEDGKTYILGNSNSAVNAGVISLVSRLDKGALETGTYEGEYDSNYSLTNGYKLTWAEEFNGTELSETWIFCDADGYTTVSGGETVFSMDNGKVENGVFTATSYKVEDSNNTSGFGMYTRGTPSMYFKYGYVEARIKLSTIDGYETALWMTTVDGGKGANYFIGEFDIFENCGLNNSIRPNLHVHSQEYRENILQGTNSEYVVCRTDENLGNEYHNFGMEWTDDTINFYLDGKRYYSFDCTAKDSYKVFDQLASINFCHASESNGIATTVNSADSYIDWIRVWQKDDSSYEMVIK